MYFFFFFHNLFNNILMSFVKLAGFPSHLPGLLGIFSSLYIILNFKNIFFSNIKIKNFVNLIILFSICFSIFIFDLIHVGRIQDFNVKHFYFLIITLGTSTILVYNFEGHIFKKYILGGRWSILANILFIVAPIFLGEMVNGRLQFDRLDPNSLSKIYIIILAVNVLRMQSFKSQSYDHILSLIFCAFYVNILILTNSVGVIFISGISIFVVSLIYVIFLRSNTHIKISKKLFMDFLLITFLALSFRIAIDRFVLPGAYNEVTQHMATLETRLHGLFYGERPTGSARLEVYIRAYNDVLSGRVWGGVFDFGPIGSPHNIYLEVFFKLGLVPALLLAYVTIKSLFFYVKLGIENYNTHGMFEVFVYLCLVGWACIGGDLVSQVLLFSFWLYSIVDLDYHDRSKD